MVLRAAKLTTTVHTMILEGNENQAAFRLFIKETWPQVELQFPNWKSGLQAANTDAKEAVKTRTALAASLTKTINETEVQWRKLGEDPSKVSVKEWEELEISLQKVEVNFMKLLEWTKSMTSWVVPYAARDTQEHLQNLQFTGQQKYAGRFLQLESKIRLVLAASIDDRPSVFKRVKEEAERRKAEKEAVKQQEKKSGAISKKKTSDSEQISEVLNSGEPSTSSADDSATAEPADDDDLALLDNPPSQQEQSGQEMPSTSQVCREVSRHMSLSNPSVSNPLISESYGAGLQYTGSALNPPVGLGWSGLSTARERPQVFGWPNLGPTVSIPNLNFDPTVGGTRSGLTGQRQVPLISQAPQGQLTERSEQRSATQNPQVVPWDNLASCLSAANFDITKYVSPAFTGKPSEYQSFRLSFLEANETMRQLNFSPARRFREMKKVVKGHAFPYINKLPVTDDSSLDEAWENLHREFGGSIVRCRDSASALLSLKECSGSHEDRQRFHGQLSEYKNSKKSLGVSAEQQLFALELTIIESKLDKGVKERWVKYQVANADFENPLGSDIDWATFLKQLRIAMEEQRRLDQIMSLSQGGKPQTRKPKGGGQQKPPHATAQSFPVSTGPQPSQTPSQPDTTTNASSNPVAGKVKIPCPLCKNSPNVKGGDHAFPLSCQKLKGDNKMTYEQLVKIIDKKKLCENCLDARHTAADCTAPQIKCRVKGCNERHCVAIHRVRHQQQE